jgi:hypothetical protein
VKIPDADSMKAMRTQAESQSATRRKLKGFDVGIDIAFGLNFSLSACPKAPANLIAQ